MYTLGLCEVSLVDWKWAGVDNDSFWKYSWDKGIVNYSLSSQIRPVYWVYKKISRPRFDRSLKRDLIKVTLIKNQGRIKEDKARVRVRKSRYVDSDKTYCYTEKFNIALSLQEVLDITLNFSKACLEANTVFWSDYSLLLGIGV